MSRTLIALTTLVTLVTACTSSTSSETAADLTTASDATTDDATTDAAGSAPTDTNANTTVDVAADTTLDVATDVTFEFGPGTTDVLDPTVGLDELASYHAVLTMSFDGTRAGAPEAWQVVRDVIVSQDPAIRILSTTQTGTAPSVRTRVEIGPSRYERIGDGACATSVFDADEMVFVSDADPAAWLPELRGADDAGATDVGGVAAHHATFDERAFGSLDASTSTGEVWTADDGGYVLGLHVESVGGSGFLGHDATGTLTIDYVLDAIGTPVAADVPAGCDVGVLDVALPPDAHDVVQLPSTTKFVSSTTPADVLAFYEQQLAASGWQTDGPAMASADGVLGTFVRGAERLLVLARPGEGGTQVTLVQDGPTM